ncbi:2-C-methyl-D-erythritol 2,4-cyclodiphosphate synthase [Planctomicrobium piriforme]|uniref:2-C-methyl-D-erythritol 2,4-cyclodiphosphate synthase n=1 Tax=Planctomicrobium piriforme TaxID=1576369 RepID=A0A1I3PWR0_9PLAN|nr:2-C-methyl-D-erythritol 2,4-cyclodiphosphate synthase [Planctomicrobium piriforme]SFJ25366.1 2-C-methyl-D-erythritol 2,4-cyclodiphosphate synthase [Planctomicrobium piriforme]
MTNSGLQHRIGIGHDTHRLEPGRDLIIGGVPVPHDKGCIAHSDGDVLLHALTDAILGALAWGDIGEWFPDTDPAYRGADSLVLLRRVLEKVFAEGWQITNADCIVFAQRPKLSQLKPKIRERVAEILQVSPDQVSVKAKTGEHVGPIGREEAVAAEVVVLLGRNE